MQSAARNDERRLYDLHVHSTASDGGVPPVELAALARRAGLAGFALTDHDCLDGIAEASEACRREGIDLVPGVELTTYWRDGDETAEVHVIGYFVDAGDGVLGRRLAEFQQRRVERVYRMCEKLREVDVEIAPEDVLERAERGAVGRVHFAQELVKAGACGSVQEAFDRLIGNGCPGYVPKPKMAPEEAVELVRAAGGCAALAHPGVLTNGERLATELVPAGLAALEVHYPSHSPEQEARFLDLARELDLVPTGGSDFHGEAKPDIRMGMEFVSEREVDALRAKADNGTETL